MKKGMVLSLLLLFFLSYFAPKSVALSCAFGSMIEPWMEWDNRADAVIVATVTDVKQDGTGYDFKVNVLESYKGIEVNQITITEKGSWDRGGTLNIDETYILGLLLEDNKWILPVCHWIPSSMDSYLVNYQELSAYPKLDLADPTLSQYLKLDADSSISSSVYWIAILIVLLTIAVLVSVYLIKRRHRR